VGEAEERYLTVSTDPDGTVVVTGEVDLYSAPTLEQAVKGLNILVRCFKPLDEQGRRLVLRSPQDAVRRTLEIGGITTLVDVES
jgi:anti-anti-sigma regulatory factor